MVKIVTTKRLNILFLSGIGTILLIGLYYFFLATPKNSKLIFDPRTITPASPLYLVQSAREHLQSMFVLGDLDTAGWHLTLAQKRIEEAKILKNHELTHLSLQQITKAQQHQAETQIIITKLQGKTDTNFLTTVHAENERALHALQ